LTSVRRDAYVIEIKPPTRGALLGEKGESGKKGGGRYPVVWTQESLKKVKAHYC